MLSSSAVRVKGSIGRRIGCFLVVLVAGVGQASTAQAYLNSATCYYYELQVCWSQDGYHSNTGVSNTLRDGAHANQVCAKAVTAAGNTSDGIGMRFKHVISAR